MLNFENLDHQATYFMFKNFDIPDSEFDLVNNEVCVSMEGLKIAAKSNKTTLKQKNIILKLIKETEKAFKASK